MLLKEFPDIHWLKKAIKQNFAEKRSWDNKVLPDLGWPTAILNVKTTQAERKDIKGPFSLFLNQTGSSEITCDRKSIRLNTDTFSFSNHGQNYDLLIDENQPTETYNIHFGERLFQDTLQALTLSNNQLLDNSYSSSTVSNLTIKSNFRSNHFNKLITHVQNCYETEAKENALFELLSYVLIENNKHIKHIDGIECIKTTTKQELVKRIYLSLDYIHANYARPINLNQLADASMLSKFHFLRVFKALFLISPHQYIKRIRLEKAIALIKGNQIPLYLIAQQVGIENGSSLSRMMYQITGQRPSTFMSN